MEISLVLGAGGARGCAHIGVLRALAEFSWIPVNIVGVSMGAVIGAAAAAGVDSERILDLLQAGRKRPIWLPLPGRRGGLLDQRHIIHRFCRELPETIDDLRVPFAVIAADIDTGESVVLDSGSLRSALEATVAVPGLLSPVEHNERYLVDGATVNDLPVDWMRQNSKERMIVAIDVAPASSRRLKPHIEAKFFSRLRNAFRLRHRMLPLDISLKAFAIQQAIIRQCRLEEYPPDILVRPELDPDLRLEDFDRMQEAVEAGYHATRREIRRFVDGPAIAEDHDS